MKFSCVSSEKYSLYIKCTMKIYVVKKKITKRTMPLPSFWPLVFPFVSVDYILELYSILSLGCTIIKQTCRLCLNCCYYKESYREHPVYSNVPARQILRSKLLEQRVCMSDFRAITKLLSKVVTPVLLPVGSKTVGVLL